MGPAKIKFWEWSGFQIDPPQQVVKAQAVALESPVRTPFTVLDRPEYSTREAPRLLPLSQASCLL